MGFFDSLFGRSKPARPDLDQLFAMPGAALTLEAAMDYRPTGVGAVAFRKPAGKAFAAVQQEIQDLLDLDSGPKVAVQEDTFGFTWLVVHKDPSDTPGLVTDLHAINATLQDSGFGPTLLCSLFGFAGPDGQQLAMVYLFKQGTYYPFAPVSSDRRDNMLELQVRDELGSDLRFEPELGRWFALWGAPGL